VKSFFARRGIPYREKDINLDRQARMEWSQKWHGDIVPLVVLDDGRRVVEGADLKALERALAELGMEKGK
jgi:glutaredoxin